MTRGLRYSDEALEDLARIARWLTQPGARQRARRKLDNLWMQIERLRDQPCVYPAVLHPGVRELPCAGGYRALYEVHPDTGRNEDAGDVLVLRVFGPGQDRGRP